MSTDEAYVTRYGFPPEHWGVIAIAATFTLLAIFLPMGTFLRIVTLVFFGGGGVLLLVAGLSRKVALRVDESGITLGGFPFRYAATTAHVPWRDVEAVVLWRQELAAGMPYIGVLRPHGAPPLPGIPTGTAGRGGAGRGGRGGAGRAGRSTARWIKAPLIKVRETAPGSAGPGNAAARVARRE